jgi:hypothetical protein
MGLFQVPLVPIWHRVAGAGILSPAEARGAGVEP